MTQPTTEAYKPIKLIKGIQAIDGTLHPNMKSALAASKEVKIKDALKKLAEEVVEAAHTIGVKVPGVIEEPISDTANKPIIDLSAGNAADLADFLYANKAELLAAFNQEVRQRKPRTPKAKPASAS